MQRIERYGVIALVFLLVTILAVSLWGEHRGKSVFPFLNRAKKGASDAVATDAKAASATGTDVALGVNDPLHPMVPLSAAPQGGAPIAPPVAPAGGGLVASAPMDPAGSSLGAQHDFGTAFDAYSAPSTTESFVPAASLAQQGSAPIGPTRAAPITQPVARGSGFRTYVVRPNETLGEIAQRELGTYRRWTDIQRLNDGLDPAKVRAGMTIKLPESAAAVVAQNNSSATSRPAARAAGPKGNSAPKAESGVQYQVKSGDTLSRIAQRELGDADEWRAIVAANPGLDPKRLVVGSKLKLPVAPRAARSTEERVAAVTAPSTKKSRVR